MGLVASRKEGKGAFSNLPETELVADIANQEMITFSEHNFHPV
mgnify:CR=1 FL=1